MSPPAVNVVAPVAVMAPSDWVIPPAAAVRSSVPAAATLPVSVRPLVPTIATLPPRTRPPILRPPACRLTLPAVPMTGRSVALLFTTRLPKALNAMSPLGGVADGLPMRAPELPGLKVMLPPASTVILAAAVLVPVLPIATPESATVPPVMSKLPPIVSVRSRGVDVSGAPDSPGEPGAPMRAPLISAPAQPPWDDPPPAILRFPVVTMAWLGARNATPLLTPPSPLLRLMLPAVIDWV